MKAKQELVGGLIEVSNYDDALLVSNEEGKLLNMPPNLIFDYDFIAGDCFIAGDDYKNGDFKSLTNEQILRFGKDLIDRSFRYLSSDKNGNIIRKFNMDSSNREKDSTREE